MNTFDIIKHWDDFLVEKHIGSEISIIVRYFKEKNKTNISYLDIGANTGKYYDVLARSFQIDLSVMVEASKALYDYLLIKFENNNNTKIYNLILSDINDMTSFADIDFSYITDIENSNLGLSKLYKSDNNTREQTSSGTFFENYILQNNIDTLDLIKIDTENKDYEILKSLTNVIPKLKNQPLICFEHNYHNSMTQNEAQDILNNFTNTNNYASINIGDITWSAVFMYPKTL
jgi:FkbM family methyltransferase